MADEQDKKVTTAAGWKKRAVHTITLPSGAVVKIRLPDIPALLESGDIPQELLSAALGQGAEKQEAAEDGKVKEPSKEELAKRARWVGEVVSRTVVEPTVTVEEVVAGDLPIEDRDMLMEFAMRQTDMDAAFEHIGGLHKVQSFREARGLTGIESLLAGM